MYNDLLKDPVLRSKIEAIVKNPSGDTIAELDEQDINTLAGAGLLSGISAFLGNKGAYCTITKECQPNCN